MKIKLTDKEVQWCREIGMRRSGSKNHADTKHSKNMFPERHGSHRHFIGVVGELAYAKMTGQNVDTTTLGKGDKGIDFKDGSDVKTSTHSSFPKLAVTIHSYNRKIPKQYVLMWTREPYNEVRFMGKISRKRFDKIKKIVNWGYWDNYIVDFKELDPLYPQQSFLEKLGL